MNHICLLNINIDQEIDSWIGICYTLNALMAYGINSLVDLLQNSVCHVEERTHTLVPSYMASIHGPMT